MFFSLDHVMNCSSRLAADYIGTVKLEAYKELQFCKYLETVYVKYMTVQVFKLELD